MMLSELKTCRLCDSEVVPVFELTPTPLANDFKPYPDSNAVRYPLGLSQCLICEHVQQRYSVDAHTLYSDYKYSTPEAVRPYLEEAAVVLRERFPKARWVLEIGSNNGLNLEILGKHFSVWGVDPSAKGEFNEVGFFSEDWSKKRLSVKFDLIIANHVFAHIEDLNDVFRGIDLILAPEGALVFEVQYLPDLINRGAFDMIYHEHMDYHTVGPLIRFFDKHGLVMTNLERLPRQGGSIRVTAQRSGVGRPYPEETIGWNMFSSVVKLKKEAIRKVLGRKKVAAFGAAAKACTLIHHYDIADNISCCIDDDPLKWGLYIPGTDIPIVQDAPGTVLLLAWNFDVQTRFKDVILP